MPAVAFTALPVMLVAALLGSRLLAAPIHDLTKALGIPQWADRYLQRDELAYPFHAALGAGIERLGGSPAAAGVQWAKAASHARSGRELERAARGIAEAGTRDGDGAHVRGAVCPLARGQGRASRVATAIRQSGLACVP